MNSHVKEYLNSYINLDNPQYAIILKGEWGSGKTHFIKEYIKDYSKDDIKKSKKFIYISLFGLKNTGSIDDLIFQQLHPFLASKSAKLVGGIIKSAFKFGLKYDIDLNKNEKNEAELGIDLENINIVSFMKDQDLPSKVFVFDDLERCVINLPELLGYINSMTEQSELKVILIANENEIVNKDIYNKFKEKVINESFVIKTNKDSFFEEFINDNENISDYSELIKRVIDITRTKNYRVIKQTVDNYKFFSSFIDGKFLENKDFEEVLIEHYFIRSLIGKGSNDINKEDVYKNILSQYHTLFSEDYWNKIINEFDFNRACINDNISKLYYFQENKEEESWRTLWNYLIIDSERFYSNLTDMVFKFKNFYYESPVVLLHVVELLLLFIDKKIEVDISAESINSMVLEYISKYSNHNENWLKSNEISNFFNSTGLGFINQDNPDVLKIRELINKSLVDNKKVQENERISEEVKGFVTSIKSNDQEKISEFLLKYETIPILKYVNPEEVFNLLIDDRSRNIFEIGSALVHRYSENRYLNSKPYYSYLLEETIFIEELRDKIKYYQEENEDKPFIRLKLDKLKSVLNDLVVKLNSYQ